MGSMQRTNTAIALLLGLVAALAPAQSGTASDGDQESRAISVARLLEETGAELMWDPFREVATFRKGEEYATMQLGQNRIAVNYRELREVPSLRRRNGDLMVPTETAEALRSVLGRREDPDGPRVAAIFIDPGHGGKDPGAIGRHTFGGEERVIHEKDVVLDVGKRLRTLLAERFPDRQVMLSRKKDVYLNLEERTELANRIETDQNETILFLSLHANASFNEDASGFEVWYLPPEYRRKGLVDAKSVGVQDPDVLSILNRIREEELTVGSIMLARQVSQGLEARIGSQTANRGLKEESWYVVRNAEMPSVLVEVGFVTNKEEAQRLVNASYLNKLVRGIYTGVRSFIKDFEG